VIIPPPAQKRDNLLLLEGSMQLQSPLHDSHYFDAIVAESSQMQQVLEIARQLASTHATALIQGGKWHGEGGDCKSYPCLEPSGQSCLDHHRLHHHTGIVNGKRTVWP
jgi:transcriptional regulator of aromatic amino acid metabolism